MFRIKPEVAEFKKLIEEDKGESADEAIVRIYAVLIDIRDLLIK